MPKGIPGCYACGARDESIVVQVWMRAYTDDVYANGVRKQVSVDSRTRVFCAAHAEDAYLAATAALEREIPAFHGCAICGERCDFRIQAILGRSRGTITASMAGSYCSDHVEAAFERACASLAGDWHHTGQGEPGVTGFRQ